MGPLVQVAKEAGQGQYVLHNLVWEGPPGFARVIDDTKPFKAVWIGAVSGETHEEWHHRFMAAVGESKD